MAFIVGRIALAARRLRVGRNAVDYEPTIITVLKCFSKINASLYLFVCVWHCDSERISAYQ